MRIASTFQRRTGPGPGALGRGGMYAALACSMLGCFFGLEDVVPSNGLGGGGGSSGDGTGGTGSFPPIGGDASVGGTGGAFVDPSCPPNEQRCGGDCVAISTATGCGALDCTPCAALQQANLRCDLDNRTCEVADCVPGFADCNGDTSTYTGQAGGDGCEYNFGQNGELRPAPDTLEVPLLAAAIDISDGSRQDWAGIPAYPFLATCDDCVDTSLPTVTVPNVVPPRDDLDAYFRVAWDRAFFYVLADVYDTTLVADGDQRQGNCQGTASSQCEDSLTVLVDGHNNRGGLSNEDLYLFLGFGGAAFRVAQTPVDRQVDMDFKATPNGAACYRIEARLTWNYMTGTQAGQPIDPNFVPEPGKQYGFDVAVNDWDPGVSDPEPLRESQVFWVDPGNGFQQNTANFGTMTLTEGVTNVPSGPK